MRIRTRTLVIMISQGLAQATTILLAIIVVRIIDQATLGTYRQTFLTYVFLGGVITLQLDNSLYYFVPKLGVLLRRTLLLQTFLCAWAMATIIWAVMFFGAEQIARIMNNPELAGTVRILSFYPFVDRLAVLIPAFMISLDRAVRSAVYSLVGTVARIGVTAALFATGHSLHLVMWWSVACVGIISAVGCADMLRLSRGGPWRLDRKLFLEQLSYSWPLLIGGIVGTITIQFDKLVISGMFDPAKYAVYSCGAIDLPVVGLITTSVATAIMPNLVTMADSGKFQEVLDLWQEGARKCALVLFPCFAFFLFTGPDVIVLLYGKAYAMAAWPFAIYILMLPFKIAAFTGLLRALGKTKPIAISTFMDLAVMIVFGLGLTWLGRGSLLSFLGSSLGALISYFVVIFYYLWVLHRQLNVPFAKVMRWKELGGILAVCVACGVIIFLIPLGALPLPIRLGIRGVIFAAVLLAGMLRLGILSADEKRMLAIPLNLARKILGGAPRSS